jgi:multicomponent K+:H+ antiporter subunit D
MTHWIIMPVILPAILAPFILMVLRHHLDLQRVFSVAGTVALVAISGGLMLEAAGGGITVYDLGDWPAPFGIVLVLDRLSAMMVLLTTVLGLAVLLYAIGTGWDTRGRHFHALFQFQLMGVLGAFLTGDAFNLFVFFEILLIASYGLMIHSGGANRLRVGVQYVAYNLLGSTLFLFALAVLYGVTGTLNMADMAERVAALPPEDTALIRVGAVLLLLVFAVKAALLPLHFWLPASYAAAPGPVAALFAIMTKVGAYAILRFYTLIFGPDLAITSGIVATWLLPAALVTLTVGAIGMLGTRDLGRLAAYAVVASMGTLLATLALFTVQSTGAVIYYTVHSTFASALLFLVVDMVRERRGGALEVSAPMAQSGLIAALFFAAAIVAAGMPPFSGFLGKLLVLDAARDAPQAVTIWTVVLVTSLVMILGLARAGSVLFWKPYDAEAPAGLPAGAAEVAVQGEGRDDVAPGSALPFAAVFAMLAAIVLLTVFAGPMMRFADATAAQLFTPGDYIDAVLKRIAE